MTDTRTHMSDDAGFTLVESLVALLLMAVVATLSVSVFASYLDNNRMVTQTLTELDQMTQVRRTLSDDLKGITLKQARDQSATATAQQNAVLYLQNPVIDKKEAQPLLAFTRRGSMLADIDPARSSVERVVYLLKGRSLIRRSFARPSPNRATPFVDKVLITGVQRVRLNAETRGLVLDQLSLKPDTQGAVVLPSLIRLSLVMQGANQLSFIVDMGAQNGP